MYLSDIFEMTIALRHERTGKIKLLYKLFFDDLADRNSRDKLWKFPGFGFQPESNKLKNKLAKAQVDFSLNQLITVANAFQISNEGNIEESATWIASSLNDLNV